MKLITTTVSLTPSRQSRDTPLHKWRGARAEASRTLLTTVLLLLYLLTNAQQYAFKKYTIRDGLPQSQVMAVAQDEQGYIWLSTKDGVARFDGLHFTNYFEKDGIARDLYLNIAPDGKGNVYFFGVKHQYRYNGSRFVPLAKSPSVPDNEIPFTRSGNAFYGAPVHEVKGNTIYTIRHDSIVPALTIFFDTTLYSITNSYRCDSASQLLWVRLATFTQPYRTLLQAYTATGQLRFQNKAFEFNHYSHKLYPTRHGLYFTNWHNKTIYHLTDSPRYYLPLPPDFPGNVKDIDVDDFGNVFLASNQHLYVKLAGSNQFQKLPHRFTLINALFADAHGQLWVADEGALYKFHHFAFTHFNEQDGITKNIWSVVEDENHHYWMGGFGSGLFYYNGKTFTDHSHPPYYPENNIDNIYMGALRDFKNRVLIPNAYWITAIKNQQPTHHRTGQHTLYLLADSTEKRIYACGTSGVVILNKELKVADSIPKGKLFPGNVLFAMNATLNAKGEHRQCRWFGNNRFIATITNGRIDTGFYNQHGKPVGGLCMTQDGDGNIWLGNHDGLTLFNGKTYHLYNQPPFTRGIATLLQYNDTTLYAGLNDGFAILNTAATIRTDKPVFRLFNEHNGFIGIEPGQNGFYRDSRNNIWLTTTEHVTCINPRLLPPENNRFNTFVTAAYMQDDNYNWQLHETTDNPQADTLLTEIPYNNKRLKFTFGAIHHTAPENTRFIYRLAGFDTKWSEPTTDPEALYTHLPPGNYTFMVRAGQGNLFTEQNEARLYFTIHTPLWRQLWFIALCILAAIAFVIAITYWLTRYFRIQKEAAIKLQLELNNLQYMALKTQIEPHFASNLLNSVNAAILHEDKRQASRILGRFAGFIREILKANDAQTHTLQQELNFIEQYIELEKVNLKHKLQYSVQTTGSVNLQRLVPVMLLHTFVENAVKHAIKQSPNGGSVQLHLQQQPQQLSITITDTGTPAHSPSGFTGALAPTRKGIALIERILNLYNQRNRQQCTLHITDSPAGRTVQIIIPNGYKF
ncbi:MAG: histidine kinase [Chitinophagales bacterium]|nr:histidine kinase [Chitinophagales bacterium]